MVLLRSAEKSTFKHVKGTASTDLLREEQHVHTIQGKT